MNAKISMFVISVETIIYFLFYNLRECTFNDLFKYIEKVHIKLLVGNLSTCC